MGILRDDSGYVMVLRRPRLMLVEKAPEKDQASNQIGAVPATQTTCSIPHCCFYCRWCGEQILLPNDRIGSPFGFPDARKIDVRSIASVCFACRHISSYSMFRTCRGFDTRHKITQAQNRGKTVLLNWLQCEEPTCRARVPLFVRFDANTPPEETEAAEWLWDELTCALGHCIKQIPIDPTLELPLRTYSESR